MKISLVSPNNPGSYRAAQIVTENLGIATLASYVEALGHEVQVIDARLSNQHPDESARAVKAFSPSVLGVSLICEEAVRWTNDFLDRFGNSAAGPICLAGGYFPTLQPETALTLMPRVDASVLGEGEIVLEEVLRRLTKSPETWRESPGMCVRSEGSCFQRTRRPPLLRDLDQLPWPRRCAAPHMTETFDVLIEGSRGCKLACTFCAIRPFFQSSGESVWRGRTPESLVAEMTALRQANPQLRRFRFVDPDFFGFEAAGARRALRLAELIAEDLPGIEFYIEVRAKSIMGNVYVFRSLRDAGLREVFIGVESGSQRILNKILKNTTVEEALDAIRALKALGISINFGFMMFTPWTNEGDLRANISTLRAIGGVRFDSLFHEMELIPGTPAIKQAQMLGPIMPKRGTGYYTYTLSGLAERARLCGRALEARHRDFMERVWLLYKDAQRSIQIGHVGANDFDRRVTELNLTMFEFCIDALRSTAGQEQAAVEATADACVRHFDGAVTALSASIEEDGRFPRAAAIRQAAIQAMLSRASADVTH